MFKYGLIHLLLAVVFVAVAIVLLLNASETLRACVAFVTINAFAAAIVLAIYHKRARAFWMGFLVFGGMQEFIVFTPGSGDTLPEIVLSAAYDYWVKSPDDAVDERPLTVAEWMQQPKPGTQPPRQKNDQPPSRLEFTSMGQLLFVLLMAVLGGWLAMFVQWRMVRSTSAAGS